MKKKKVSEEELRKLNEQTKRIWLPIFKLEADILQLVRSHDDKIAGVIALETVLEDFISEKSTFFADKKHAATIEWLRNERTRRPKLRRVRKERRPRRPVSGSRMGEGDDWQWFGKLCEGSPPIRQ